MKIGFLLVKSTSEDTKQTLLNGHPLLPECFGAHFSHSLWPSILHSEDSNMNLGKIVLRLDRVMADRKMSLNELSEKVGVANVNLSKMKNGRISAIRFSTLAAICQVLQCQPGDILEYEPDEE